MEGTVEVMSFQWRMFPMMVAAILSAGTGPGALHAQEAGQGEKKPFTIDQVIHPVVAALPAPEFRDEIVSLPMAISSPSEAARRHVLHGLAHIQAAWDFEAYRHFCEAVKADPNCLMGYWGIGLALAAPNNEFARERMVAVERMLDLVDATVEVGEEEVPAASPLERDYALALARLFSLQPGDGPKAFQVLSEDYPNNLQAKCLAIYLQREGYDEFGDPLYGQEVAIEKMGKLVRENPDNIAVMTFWAMLHAEAPEATTLLRDDILPVVRKIARKAPQFPPYQHLLGHFEWRCGNHRLAEAAFTRAVDLYAAHMKAHKQTFLECDGWVRCQLYLATVMHSRGRFEEAMAIAKKLAALQVDGNRLGAAGANLVVWEARTLPARLYLARGWKGDFDLAIASLPAKDDPQLFVGRTLSLYYLEGLRQYLGVRRKLEQGKREEAHSFRQHLSRTSERLGSLRSNASKSSSISEYVRAATALEVYAAEARGMVAWSGDASERGVARSWFTSAIGKQQRPSLLMPPVVVSPMELRLAEYYDQVGENNRAAEFYRQALLRRPNDLKALKGYQEALLRIGRKEAALQTGEIIKQVEGR